MTTTKKDNTWYTDAVKNVACPKCNEQAGSQCKSPQGKNVSPHATRLQAYDLQIASANPLKRATPAPIPDDGLVDLEKVPVVVAEEPKAKTYAIQIIDNTGRIIATLPMDRYPDFNMASGKWALTNLGIDIDDAITDSKLKDENDQLEAELFGGKK